jgi:protein SDA1
MAVGINAARAMCARVPSVLSNEEEDDGEGDDVVKSTAWDVEAFVRDLAGYAKHKDRSVSIAGRGWTNFIREVYPSLLQGKDRGLVGAGLHRAGEKPLRYGEVRAASGVEGADLLMAYEAAKKRKKESGEDDDGSDSDGDGEDGWVEVDSGDEENEIAMDDGDDDGDEESDEEAPDLVLLGEDQDGEGKPKAEGEEEGEGDDQVDLSKLSKEDRAEIQKKMSSTRIFSASEFAKMQKLVEREKRARRDPRLAAKLKRAKARGEEYEDVSDSDSDMDSDDEGVHVKGAVDATDIMAEAKRKRMSKAEKLEKIIEGRQKWEASQRAGGSTNTEKKRKKNFAMSKFAFSTRKKIGEKGTAKMGRKQKQMGRGNDGRAAKKRRRKF